MVRLLGGLQRYWSAWLVRRLWCGALQDKRKPSPAVQGLGLRVLMELSMLMFKLEESLDEAGSLPVSLTKVSHWHGFIEFPDDGAVSIRRRRRETKKRWK